MPGLHFLRSTVHKQIRRIRSPREWVVVVVVEVGVVLLERICTTMPLLLLLAVHMQLILAVAAVQGGCKSS
jgi:hypothetical protein